MRDRSDGPAVQAPMNVRHDPVMLNEVVRWLAPRAGGTYVDGTIGAGGHAAEILRVGAPDARLFGIDRDAEAIEMAAERLRPFGDRARLVQWNFEDVRHLWQWSCAHWACPDGVDGILFDLGVGSYHFDDPGRGFSAYREGPLDMRMDRREPLTAARIVHEWEVPELEALLWGLGDESRARRVARAIGHARHTRALHTTSDLAEVIQGAMGHPLRLGGGKARARRDGVSRRTHPATRSFQAIRMAVNRELWCLRAGVAGAIDLLVPGGRLCVMRFHSGEDRIVKDIMHQSAKEGVVRVLVDPPVAPGVEERRRNPRSRSAKLRVAEKM